MLRYLGKIIALISIIGTFFLMGLVIYWLNYPYRPIVITSQPMRVDPKIVKIGENINLYIEYCKYIDISADVSQQWIDDLIYTRPSFQTKSPLGCHSTVVSLTVPPGLPVSTYIIDQVYTYKVNPLREVQVEARSEPFQIIK